VTPKEGRPPPDTKRRDTGEETLSVVTRPHAICHERGHCGAIDCPAPQARRSRLARVVAVVRRLLGG